MALLLVGFSLVLACSPPGGPQPSAPSGAAPDLQSAAKNGGRVVIGIAGDIAGLNPLLWTDPQSTTVSLRIYEPLVVDDPQTGEPQPRLAESWALSADGTHLSFTLRPGLVWSDGSPLTVDDVVFTFMSMVRSRTAPKKSLPLDEVVGTAEFADGRAAAIVGISTQDRTITFELTRPLCTVVDDLGGIAILPKSVFGRYLDTADVNKTMDDAPENNAPPLSSGPFRFKEWVARDHVLLVRNDHFFLGPARLDEWVLRILPGPTAVLPALRTGEVQVATVNPRDQEELDPNAIRVLSTPGTGYTGIQWNQLRGGKEFLREKSVRQALTYALDWNSLISTLLKGQGQRVVSHTPPVNWAYDDTGLNRYAFDPQKARQILESANWQIGPDGIYEKDGQRLAFTLSAFSESDVNTSIIQVAAQQYRQVGVDATPRNEPRATLLARWIGSRDATYGDLGGHDYDAMVINWVQVGPDPDAFWYWHSSSVLGGANRVGYENPTVDRAIEDGRTQCTRADRKAAYHRMDLQLNEDQPVGFGFVANTLLAVSNQIQGVQPGPYSILAQWNIEAWSTTAG